MQEATDGSAGRPPRVWPVLAVYAGTLAAMVALAVPLAALTAGLDPASVLVVGAVASSLVFVASAWLASDPWRRRLAERLGLSGAPISWRRTAAYCLGILGLSQAMDSIVVLTGLGEKGVLPELGRVLQDSPPSFLPIGILVLGFGAGTCEEIFFRGYMQTRLTARIGPAAGIPVVALLFGAAHLDMVQSPAAAAMGLFLGWVRQRSGSVWPAVAAHIVNNSVWLLLTHVGDLPLASHVALLLLGLAVVGAVILKDRSDSG
jgi:membrane protease YdiL (CAAX protease family)